MKRLLSGIIILLLLLSGCGTKAGGTEDPPAISAPPAQNAPETPPAENTHQPPAEPVSPVQPELPEIPSEEVRLEWVGNSRGVWPFGQTVELLQFCGSEDPELAEANDWMLTDVENQISFFETAYEKGEDRCRLEGDSWSSLWAYPVTTDRYLSAVTIRREHMQFRIDDPYTWNLVSSSFVYDKEERRLISLDEALNWMGVSVSDLARAIWEFAANQNIGTYEDLSSIGFYMDPAGYPVFIIGAVVYGHGPSVGWPTFFNWDNGEIRWPGDEPMPLGLVDTDWDELACLQSLKQYEGAAMISESEAMETLCEIVEVQDALLLGMSLKHDDTTVMIDGEVYVCIGLGVYRDTGFAAERLYAVSWNSVYAMDPLLQEWVPVGFG